MSDRPDRAALERALVEAINDEYKACATYGKIIKKFGPIRPFVNIIESEKRHIMALIPLFKRYEIPIPEDDWETRVTAPASVQEACEAGVRGEIENAEMYRRLLSETRNYFDVQTVFLNLRRASQFNHLTAFRRCAERGGTASPHRQGMRGGCGGGGGRGRRHRRRGGWGNN
ncbi:DUF2202 domain-containing protein [Lyngbya sp. CCY1209]|uniref:ferritin-like domain-containing protein n=1 Tax=Lyngbya sp. CCY1209 TaxID=2886103 RepID=UPI002D2012B9|nr:DUF2202 domain-containing protein [Lyngbya sp. CCY1209]MEB3884290.1 DUF2202 domain-containing protein [Lyngbya sp. CCY1209]